MIHTISWMVIRENEARQISASRVVLTMFLVGGLTGGLMAGALVGLVGLTIQEVSVPRGMMVAVTGATVVALSGDSFGLYRFPRPQLPHQVPVAWRDLFSPSVAAFFYSGSLGFGFATRIPSRAYYLLVLGSIGLYQGFLPTMVLFGIAGLAKASTGLLVPLKGLTKKGGEAVAGELEHGLWLSRGGEALVLLAVGIGLVLLNV